MIEDLRKFGLSRDIVLPPQNEILNTALKEVEAGFGHDPDRLKGNFDTIMLDAEQIAYKHYLAAEREYGGQLLGALFDELFGGNDSSEATVRAKVLTEAFPLLDKFFLSLAQGRKSRAGSAFEFFHNRLFHRLGYPFEEQTLLSDSKPDFLMPSADYYQHNPLQSIVFTAKRTLRERWRQITTEGTRGIGLYLATIDPKVTEQQLHHMLGHKIFLVVPEAIRAEFYRDATNVLSFARFFEDHLDPKMHIWKRDGAV